MKTLILLNPASGGGRAWRFWKKNKSRVLEALNNPDVRISEEPGHLIQLAEGALRDGYTKIIAAGGDGTLHEVVNGLFLHPINDAKVVVGLLHFGTGGDFRRNFGLKSLDDQIAAIQRNEPTMVDLLKLRYRNFAGEMAECLGVNVAALGLAGEVDRQAAEVSGLIRFWGAKAIYFWASLKTMVRYRGHVMQFQAESDHFEGKSLLLAMANGQFFGGGIPIAPSAKVSNGRMFLNHFQSWSFLQTLKRAPNIYAGRWANVEGSSQWLANSIHVETEADCGLDVDGEFKGTGPITCKVLPQIMPFLI